MLATTADEASGDRDGLVGRHYDGCAPGTGNLHFDAVQFAPSHPHISRWIVPDGPLSCVRINLKSGKTRVRQAVSRSRSIDSPVPTMMSTDDDPRDGRTPAQRNAPLNPGCDREALGPPASSIGSSRWPVVRNCRRALRHRAHPWYLPRYPTGGRNRPNPRHNPFETLRVSSVCGFSAIATS